MTKRWSLVLGLACLTAAPMIAAGPPVKRGAESETAIYDVSARAEQRAELHRSLEARELASGLSRALEVKLTAAEKTVADTRVDDGRLRVGIEKSVGAVLQLGAALRFGDFASEPDGTIVWSGRITAPGASALRLHLSPFNLPESAELFVYAADGQAYGPYTGRGPIDDGQLWTNAIFGDEVRLQLRVAPEDVAHTKLVIADVGYMGAAFPMAGNLCGDNAACVVNAACATTIPAAIAPAKDAIAHILFRSGGFYYICTGGLIADSDLNSVVPYFLTANHCISRASEASSLETYFDYVTICGSPNCASPYGSPRSPDTLGAQIVAGNRTGDYTLMRLSSTPIDLGEVTYLGWSKIAVANGNGTALYRLSHPQGSPQAYSEHSVSTSAPTCSSWPRGSWIYSRDTLGATEGGSSGSPVLNANGQIVGQLSGGCGYNINDNCDAVSNATVDGAFASYYSQVAPFLDGGGPSCSALGASCSANSQCCSGNCKGKSGAKTCK